MKSSFTLIMFLILLTLASLFGADRKQPVDYVDPLLGTSSCRWMLFPGPCMPFGMVKLSPDNTDEWTMDAGYEYGINSISGFGHVHSWMMGSFLIMPTTGELKTAPGTKDDPDVGYRSRFDHKNETASPGYYSVLLDDYNIKAELTASSRAGFQRYTFPKTEKARILFDFQVPEEGKPEIVKASITKVSNTEIEGKIHRIMGWNDYTLYFVARFSKPFDSLTGWTNDGVKENINDISISKDGDIGVAVNFSVMGNEAVQLKTGISYVSIENARLNMETELENFGWDFDAAHSFAKKTWNKLLKKIEISGGTEDNKVKFYTNMYRAYAARTIFSDVDGRYVDMCENVQQLDDPESPIFGCDAFWNTFWNLNQLWTLVTPDVTNQWVKSLLEIYSRGGWLPKGPGGIEYTSIMVASHEIPLIVNAYQNGIRNYDTELAYQAIKRIQLVPGRAHPCGGHVGNRNLKSYRDIGYVPADEGPVSNTLEYAYDDWCVAQMAKSMQQQDDYDYFMKRSQNYKNVFDPTSGYVRPKYKGGPWLQDFVPVVEAIGKEDSFGSKDYIEGNAWQYSWLAPHDIAGLVRLMGEIEFNNRLDRGFEQSRPNFVSEFINHSNQPNMQAAFLFNYSGKPWLTQKWVREILDNYYGLGPVNGYPGDEDQGQMGAWFVMSALGLFQMDGGANAEPFYEIASPLFEEATIHLDQNYHKGKQFVIRAKGVSAKNRYIQSATLNGKPLNAAWFYSEEAMLGGELVLKMGPKPNKKWGIQPLPSQEVKTVTTPYVTSDNKLFLKQAKVTMACDTKNSALFYTLDGQKPTMQSTLYTKPFTINESTTIKILAISDGKSSLINTAYLEKAGFREPAEIGEVEPGLTYNYYEGVFHATGDILTAEPIESGVATHFSIASQKKVNFFAYTFDGFIKIPKDGLYTFILQSNDGARLSLDDRLLINNDGLHPIIERVKKVGLKAGYHKISTAYFQEGGSNHLKLLWKGPGIEREEIPMNILFHNK
jgi:predicted alpha-1,2-mannosidase